MCSHLDSVETDRPVLAFSLLLDRLDPGPNLDQRDLGLPLGSPQLNWDVTQSAYLLSLRADVLIDPHLPQFTVFLEIDDPTFFLGPTHLSFTPDKLPR